MLERWIKDFRHAARSLRRAPGFTLVVVVTLALAIGANAAIFSVVNAVLLEPLPFPRAERLVHIGGTAPGSACELRPGSPRLACGPGRGTAGGIAPAASAPM